MMTSSNRSMLRVTGPLCGEATSEFSSRRPVTRSFGVSFDLRLNKHSSKQSRGWWFETPSCSLWRDCNGWVYCRVKMIIKIKVQSLLYAWRSLLFIFFIVENSVNFYQNYFSCTKKPWRYHAMTWTNVLQVLWRHVASLGHNELIKSIQWSQWSLYFV